MFPMDYKLKTQVLLLENEVNSLKRKASAEDDHRVKELERRVAYLEKQVRSLENTVSRLSHGKDNR